MWKVCRAANSEIKCTSTLLHTCKQQSGFYIQQQEQPQQLQQQQAYIKVNEQQKQ